MATYEELFGLIGTESAVKNKVKVALLVAAKAICDEADTVPNHTQRIVWAREVLSGVDSMANRAFPILIITFKALEVSAIQAAADTAVQLAVDANVNFLAGV